MGTSKTDEVYTSVRNRYREAAATSGSCCGEKQQSCCGSSESERFGYTAVELKNLPEGADLALGCGNPTAIAGLAPGEIVVDLGSGGGIDCFIASRQVGPEGLVIGVDMTAEMIARARKAASDGGYSNVEFRLGEIEHLPIADASADVIISNCVINLSPDKQRVFDEAFRILKPSGRLMVSDIVLARELDPRLRENMVLLTGCISGALLRDEYLAGLGRAGFEPVTVETEKPYAKQVHLETLAAEAGIDQAATAQIAESVVSATISAVKPA